MKKKRGTIAYYRNSLNDLLAMLRPLGPPTLFLTLSADDLHWSEIDVLVNSHTYKDSFLQGSMFEAVQKDPFMTAVHFNHKFNALLKYIMNRPEKPFGTVVDYFVRDEF